MLEGSKRKIVAGAAALSLVVGGGLGFASHDAISQWIGGLVDRENTKVDQAIEAAKQREYQEFKKWLDGRLAAGSNELAGHGNNEAATADQQITQLRKRATLEADKRLNAAEETGKWDVTKHREEAVKDVQEEVRDQFNHTAEQQIAN